ncbi:CLUMA_CG019742, isoform A [Clunio marinus]|uniref:CLUMA_CG019742, isoform A n=1 Tax=Clunio marinus TaxID=568069 RepID=A0A1J1J4Y6_9DIPT|nr:CLUMA_CG019742, isoform A [Clunio marinus]
MLWRQLLSYGNHQVTIVVFLFKNIFHSLRWDGMGGGGEAMKHSEATMLLQHHHNMPTNSSFVSQEATSMKTL